jgi:primase-polymerase (primpol)-like protein
MPRFEPTDEQRQIVEKASDVDLPHEHICQLAPRTGRGIDRETLRSAFRLELNRGRARAGQAVANALYNNAVNSNNVAAQIWWSKAAHALERDHRPPIENKVNKSLWARQTARMSGEDPVG